MNEHSARGRFVLLYIHFFVFYYFSSNVMLIQSNTLGSTIDPFFPFSEHPILKTLESRLGDKVAQDFMKKCRERVTNF